MYIVLFIVKGLLGCVAIAVYMDHPDSKLNGIFTGVALGITLAQYIYHYI